MKRPYARCKINIIVIRKRKKRENTIKINKAMEMPIEVTWDNEL